MSCLSHLYTYSLERKFFKQERGFSYIFFISTFMLQAKLLFTPNWCQEKRKGKFLKACSRSWKIFMSSFYQNCPNYQSMEQKFKLSFLRSFQGFRNFQGWTSGFDLVGRKFMNWFVSTLSWSVVRDWKEQIFNVFPDPFLFIHIDIWEFNENCGVFQFFRRIFWKDSMSNFFFKPSLAEWERTLWGFLILSILINIYF